MALKHVISVCGPLYTHRQANSSLNWSIWNEKLLCISNVIYCYRYSSVPPHCYSLSLSSSLIWRRIYSAAFASKRSHWKVHSVEETATSVSLLSVEDKEGGYWKKEYITKQISSVKEALTQIAKPVNSYTGLPTKFKEVLRCVGCSWMLHWLLDRTTGSSRF